MTTPDDFSSYLYPFCLIYTEARMAEWSKAVVSGTILFGGVGSNPTPCIFFSTTHTPFSSYTVCFCPLRHSYSLSVTLRPETVWPSGLRRVTRNHFSSGGVGSNPAAVVFSFRLLFLFTYTHLHIIHGDSVAEWSKAVDLKSISLWERRFEPCHCRFTLRDDFWYSDVHLIYPFPST